MKVAIAIISKDNAKIMLQNLEDIEKFKQILRELGLEEATSSTTPCG